MQPHFQPTRLRASAEGSHLYIMLGIRTLAVALFYCSKDLLNGDERSGGEVG
jgi:hypothetical protein